MNVISAIPYVRSSGLNHRQFMDFLDEGGNEYGDTVYYCEVC